MTVVIAVPEPVAGRTAAMEPVTTPAVAVTPILMKTVAAVVVAVPQPAVEMTTPDTGGLKAEFRRSEAGVSQLATGLRQHIQIGARFLGTFSEISAPVTSSPHTFHQLHQVSA